VKLSTDHHLMAMFRIIADIYAFMTCGEDNFTFFNARVYFFSFSVFFIGRDEQSVQISV